MKFERIFFTGKIIVGSHGRCYRCRHALAVHRNWRSGRYEIDIIARGKGVIHIVEVKCRRAEGLTTPYEALTAKKFESLVSAAQRYIEQHNVDCEIQFDLIAATHYPDGNIEIDYVPDIRPF